MPYIPTTISLPSDIFSLSLHPNSPLLAVGLLSGKVQIYNWSLSEDLSEAAPQLVEETDGKLGYRVLWGKRRHKESCRSIAFSSDGDVLFSVGADSVLKAACSSSGKVISKVKLPFLKDSTSECPSTIVPLSAQHLLVGTDSGRIHLYDIRESSLTAPTVTWKNVHEDYVSSLTPLAASGGGMSRQFVSTGASTLAYLDFRKPSRPVIQSEDQEDELLCSAYVSGLPAKAGRGGEKILAGNSSGIVSLWNRGEWEDHYDRINVSKSSGESVDAIYVLPEGFNALGFGTARSVAVGSGDGKVRIVQLGSKRPLATLQHSMTTEEVKAWRDAGKTTLAEEKTLGVGDGVTALGVDCEGRVVSGGACTVKVWYWQEEKSETSERSDSGIKDANDGGEGSSDEGKPAKKRRKKRKGGAGKAKSAGPPNFTSFKDLD